MKSKLIQDLEKDLENLRTKKRKLIKDIDELDTKIIGVRLNLEKAIEKERYQIDQDRSKNLSTIFDEE